MLIESEKKRKEQEEKRKEQEERERFMREDKRIRQHRLRMEEVVKNRGGYDNYGDDINSVDGGPPSEASDDDG